MNTGSLRKRADRLSSEAWNERSKCKTHASASLEILRQRAGSPVGLAISFSLGFLAGSRKPRQRARPDESGGERPGRTAIAKLFAKLFEGPLGEGLIRLLSAVMAGSLMRAVEARIA